MFPRNAPLLLFAAVLLHGIPILHARRAVGRRGDVEVVEAVVDVGGTVGGTVGIGQDTDEWGEGDDDEDCEVVSPGESTVEDDRGPGRLSDGALDSAVLQGPVSLSVRDRGLVTTEVSPASILREHKAWHSEEKKVNFVGETLGYVTPWHGEGYDFARTFRSKLTYVSPVWYQLRGGRERDPSQGGGNDSPSFHLAGGHDFDEAWVSDVRNGVGERDGRDGEVTKIVPRVVLELRQGSALSRADLREMAELLVAEAVQRGYDGYVLDIPLSDGIEEFVSGIERAASRRGEDLILIQSVRPGVSLSAHLTDRLVPLIHRFSLMTYDYRPSDNSQGAFHGHRRGVGGVPNSPLSWVRECVEAFAPRGRGSELRAKTLIGIPFYGYDNGRAITSGDVVSLLTGGKVLPAGLEWDSEWKEHILSYRERRAEGMQEHVATFPTLAFIQERIDLASELGVGLALWELGQGMPYWFDLL
ncbi:unnamed protein product [Ectocarpus sp. CCAP 1310/34]|nr:unnamed protein product [Ectocarpus sp. CCAP 1310/34]